MLLVKGQAGRYNQICSSKQLQQVVPVGLLTLDFLAAAAVCIDSILRAPFCISSAIQVLYGVNQRLRVEDVDSPLCEVRPVKTVLLVVLTGDRGLCGGYNNFIIKRVSSHCSKDTAEHSRSSYRSTCCMICTVCECMQPKERAYGGETPPSSVATMEQSSSGRNCTITCIIAAEGQLVNGGICPPVTTSKCSNSKHCPGQLTAAVVLS